MPLIDGIGDEVVQFGITVIVIAVAVLAWLSTNARPDRYRTVLLMRARGHNPVTVSIRTREGTRIPRTRSSIGQTTAVDVPGPRPPTIDSSNNRVIPLQEMDSIVDADMAMMNNNRLHFYRRVEGPANIQSVEDTASTGDSSESQEEHDTEPASNAQIREMDSIVSAMEAELDTDHTTIARTTDEASSLSEGNNNNTIPPDENNEGKTEIAAQTEDNLNDDHPNTTDSTEPDGSNQRKILIKLKYINDTLKEVEGSLDEQLKDFKCRHFSAELSSERRVRLIFNGRVLGDEAATLRACGLHHRAVVHCLVQPRRTNANQPHNSAQPQNNVERPGTMHELVTEMINPERYWDLENILMTLVSLALTVVWFFRCEYSNMFTASASVALFGLTVFYSVAIFGLYLSDTFHFERRPAAQPVPTN